MPTEKPARLTTPQFAARFGVKPDTVRRSLCVRGHYFGLRPLKLPNNRLMWPDVTLEEMIAAPAPSAA